MASSAVDEVLASRERLARSGPAMTSLIAAALLHLTVAAAIVLLPRLAPPPPPLEYVAVQLVPAQRLGVEHAARQPQPAPKPPPSPPKTEPEPPPTPPTPPKTEPEPALPARQQTLPAERPPKPVKPEKPKPEPPDTRVDPTTRPKVLPPPREVLQKKLGAQAPADVKPGPPGAATGSAAGKVAVGSLTVSPENPDFNYSYYSAQTQSRIEENWTRSPVGSGVHATVSFTIHGDGSISDLKLRESSGFDTFDLAAMRSVQNAAPFAPLPRAFTLNHDSVSVIWIAR